ncbi:MAG: hypothetical protein H0W72_16530, partial [Planctomycetes bacterium]|nr:hypothetical protein [Planctomycetota bacterium]
MANLGSSARQNEALTSALFLVATCTVLGAIGGWAGAQFELFVDRRVGLLNGISFDPPPWLTAVAAACINLPIACACACIAPWFKRRNPAQRDRRSLRLFCWAGAAASVLLFLDRLEAITEGVGYTGLPGRNHEDWEISRSICAAGLTGMLAGI